MGVCRHGTASRACNYISLAGPKKDSIQAISPCRQGIEIYMDESCATRKPVARIQRNLLGTRYTVELDPSVKPWRADSVARPHGAEAVGTQVDYACTLFV